jgi:hypothetical protein
MKKLTTVFAFVLLLCLAGGCDFFRTLAGRPTSAQIEAKRERMEQRSLREAAVRDSINQARLDSAAAAQRAVADSLHAIDTLTHIGKYHKASAYANIPQSRLRTRYALVVGVFSSLPNAEKLALRYQAAGRDAYVLRYHSTLSAVLVSPCNKVAEVLESYRSLLSMPDGPKQVWVLVNE